MVQAADSEVTQKIIQNVYYCLNISVMDGWAFIPFSLTFHLSVTKSKWGSGAMVWQLLKMSFLKCEVQEPTID